MLLKILLGLLLLIGIFALVAALQPADFRVERSATVTAPAPVVFAQVNDLHRWDAWSPWSKMDPAMKKTFSEPSAGEGASMSWAGNAQVGEGRMTITESRPSERVAMKLQFLKPFACENDAVFSFTPTGGQTNVNWTMTGKKNFAAKAIGLVMNMDKMVGGQFEQGLANLKAIVENVPATAQP